MRRKAITIIAILTLAAVLFSGCAKSSINTMTSIADADAATEIYPHEAPESIMTDVDYAGKAESGAGDDAGVGSGTTAVNEADKIIYSAYARIETTEFDNTIDNVYALISDCGGFLESSSINGSDYASKYYGYDSYRSASFTIRVPKANFETVTGNLKKLGNVVSNTTNAENITAQFIDNESRLKTYRAEEESLLKMMEAADKVEDMILVEQRLSEVRYNIESITSQLKNWQNQVDYSSVTLEINEVKKYSEEVVIPKTFGDEIADGFVSSVKWLWQALKDIAVFIVKAIPVLLLPAVAVVLIIVLSVRAGRKKRAKRAAEARRQIEEMNKRQQNN